MKIPYFATYFAVNNIFNIFEKNIEKGIDKTFARWYSI